MPQRRYYLGNALQFALASTSGNGEGNFSVCEYKQILQWVA